MTTSEAAFRFTQEENVSILLLQPELNKVQWGEIDSIGTQVLNSMANQHQPNVIVDLSELNYMGSAMVALIVRVWKATLAKKGKLSVVCPHAGVREVIKLASLDKHWSLVNTQEEARAACGLSRSAFKPSGHRASGGGWGWIAIPVLLIVAVAGVLYFVKPELFRPAADAPGKPESASPDDPLHRTPGMEPVLEPVPAEETTPEFREPETSIVEETTETTIVTEPTVEEQTKEPAAAAESPESTPAPSP